LAWAMTKRIRAAATSRPPTPPNPA
jgi:hypothetical protein